MLGADVWSGVELYCWLMSGLLGFERWEGGFGMLCLRFELSTEM